MHMAMVMDYVMLIWNWIESAFSALAVSFHYGRVVVFCFHSGFFVCLKIGQTWHSI